MRPALLWLRALILLTTVMLTMGKAVWALESAPAWLPELSPAAVCVVDEPSHGQDPQGEPDRLAFPGGDDDRAELPVVHAPWTPSLPPDTHPVPLGDQQPAHPWLGLPLRPPQR